MLTALLVVIGAVGAWVLVDRLLLRRDERLQRGRAAWSQFDPARTFHSTGWEETLPPQAASGHRVEALRQRAKNIAGT
jgi:hypothetical protein